MATASPKIPYALPLDRFSPEDSGFYQIAMSRPNQRPNGRPQQHEMNTSRSPISPPTSPSQALHAQPPTDPAAIGKRPRSSDEDEIKMEDTFEDDEGRKKRSRGRPRLDTKDETAADVSIAAIKCVEINTHTCEHPDLCCASSDSPIQCSVDGHKSGLLSERIGIAKTRLSLRWRSVSKSWKGPTMT